jgi:hypothetical protein
MRYGPTRRKLASFDPFGSGYSFLQISVISIHEVGKKEKVRPEWTDSWQAVEWNTILFSRNGLYHYQRSRTLTLSLSLPQSTYGLDVLAFIGWQHEHAHYQLVEIQQMLNQRGVQVNERNVGKLYRQFLALLGGLTERKQQRLTTAVTQYGGLIWAMDGLAPEGSGSLLYVLYEVLSETPVAAIQLDHPTADELVHWLQPYQALPFPVLATLADGEDAILAAFRTCWPDARAQRCQSHWLGNVAEPVLKVDTQLREQMRQDLGGLPAVPEQHAAPITASSTVGVATRPLLPAPRDAVLIEIETQLRAAVRDAVNRPSRKPLHWGGLAGYQQLEGVAQALHTVRPEAETAYLQRLTLQVDRVLEQNRALAKDLAEAHRWLGKIADGLQYPPAPVAAGAPVQGRVSGAQVRQDMEVLLREFQPDLKRCPAQAALSHAWQRLWKSCGTDLLPCYDLVGLPQDNLKLEALFEKLRGQQRRISGRKSTQPLRDFGQSRVLLEADSEAELLQQIQQVSPADYQAQRRRLAQAEVPRQNLYRMHRDPAGATQRLITQHATRRAELARQPTAPLS